MGALGLMKKGIEKYTNRIPVNINIYAVQKIAPCWEQPIYLGEDNLGFQKFFYASPAGGKGKLLG